MRKADAAEADLGAAGASGNIGHGDLMHWGKN
jgi:hypothetical protein